MLERVKWWLWSWYVAWRLRRGRWRAARRPVSRRPKGALPRPVRARMQSAGLPPVELKILKPRPRDE